MWHNRYVNLLKSVEGSWSIQSTDCLTSKSVHHQHSLYHFCWLWSLPLCVVKKPTSVQERLMLRSDGPQASVKCFTATLVKPPQPDMSTLVSVRLPGLLWSVGPSRKALSVRSAHIDTLRWCRRGMLTRITCRQTGEDKYSPTLYSSKSTATNPLFK